MKIMIFEMLMYFITIFYLQYVAYPNKKLNINDDKDIYDKFWM